MYDHDIGGNTEAAYRRHEASELICCHALRHEALDGWGVGFDREVDVVLRYSTKSLDDVRLDDFVGWKGKPSGDCVRVHGQ